MGSEAKGYLNVAFFFRVRTSVRTSVRPLPKLRKDGLRTDRPRTDIREANDTAYTTQPNTNHTHTPTQPKTQVHSTQSKHTHTAKNTPPLPHSVRLVSVQHTPTPTQCPSGVRPAHPHSHTVSVQCPSVRCPSVRCPSSVCLPSQCPTSLLL